MRSGIPDYTTALDADGDLVLDQMLFSDPVQIIGVAGSLDILRGQDTAFAPGTGWD